jgi:hypothetical protein
MLSIFGDFDQFSEKYLAIFLKTNVLIIFNNNCCILRLNR